MSMTARQIRRAAERKAAKQARKETNRANSQLSTGPRSAEGKAISSQNALKTALTGRTVLLPTDDRTRYERHLAHYFEEWNPVGEHECILVQALADTWWRLARIPALESALYAKGRAELTDRDPDLLEVEIYLAYEKHFRNLALQERRLSSYAARLKAELEETQQKRSSADSPGHSLPLPGFEFSVPESAFTALASESAATPLTAVQSTHTLYSDARHTGHSL